MMTGELAQLQELEKRHNDMNLENYKKSELENLEYLIKEGDIEACLICLEKIKNCEKNEGYEINRLSYDRLDLENAFHEAWIEENLPISGVNGGNGILQDLLTRHDITVSDRERKIVATIIQWLGTNCGRSFLERVLSKRNYMMVKKEN